MEERIERMCERFQTGEFPGYLRRSGFKMVDALDYSALAKLTERQQLQYLLSMTSSSAERAPLADRKANVDLQPVAASKPAKAVLTTVHVCADDHDLGGDSEVSLALVDPLLPSDEERRALKGFKSIADELLPYMRCGSLYLPSMHLKCHLRSATAH